MRKRRLIWRIGGFFFCGWCLGLGALKAQDAPPEAPESSEPAPATSESAPSSQTKPASAPAPAPKGAPAQPIKSPQTLSPSSQESGSFSSDSPEVPFGRLAIPAPVSQPVKSSPIGNEDAPGGSLFSLGDTVSNYFELGAPGDPNHPDKPRLTIATNVGYDTNVLTSNTDPIASPTASIVGTGVYSFGSERLKFATSAALGATYYQKRPGDKTDYNAVLNAQGSYFITRRLQASGSLALSYLSQPNPTLVGGASRFSGDYTVTSGEIDLSYAVRPRISVDASYKYVGVTYAEENINEQQGFVDQTFQIGVGYLLNPRTTLRVDYRYNPVGYYQDNLGSDGNILTIGFNTTFLPRLRWRLDFGVEARKLRSVTEGSDDEYLGPFLESELDYELRPGAQIIGSLRYATEPSGSSGIIIRQTLRGTLVLRYTFFGRISTDFGIVYEDSRYDQPGNQGDFSQQIYSGFIALQYSINPALAVTARYDYSEVTSEIVSAEYTRSVTTLGLQVTF